MLLLLGRIALWGIGEPGYIPGPSEHIWHVWIHEL